MKKKAHYNFPQLIKACPELEPLVRPNKYGDLSVDFHNPAAVRLLNKALMLSEYGVKNWDIPSGFLVPPVPGRAAYIDCIAELLAEENKGKTPTGTAIKCLDIGTGASCIYPIIGVKKYNWHFYACDVNEAALDNAKKILSYNPELKDNIELRLQTNPDDIFYGVLRKSEKIDATLCNPPFHTSAEAATKATQRKIKNLKGEKETKPSSNFAGKSHELWTPGGEKRFVRNMIKQSRHFRENCRWFTCLISKKDNLKGVYNDLKNAQAQEVKTMDIGRGNKVSRVVAWRF